MRRCGAVLLAVKPCGSTTWGSRSWLQLHAHSDPELCLGRLRQAFKPLQGEAAVLEVGKGTEGLASAAGVLKLHHLKVWAISSWSRTKPTTSCAGTADSMPIALMPMVHSWAILLGHPLLTASS